MLGAGTVINPIIKIITTVAVLGAAYIFIVKPIMDTTNNAVNQSFGAFDQSFSGFNDLPGQIQSQINQVNQDLNNNDSQRLQNCIQQAIDHGANQQRIDRCVNRFTP